jgi:uncharacterized protein
VLVAFDPAASAAENAAELARSLAGVATGAVTTASREVQLNGRVVGAGAYLGLLNGEPLLGGGDFAAVARQVVEQLLVARPEVLTLLRGAEAPELDGLVAELERAHPKLEIELHEGGQPHYPLLVSAE